MYPLFSDSGCSMPSATRGIIIHSTSSGMLRHASPLNLHNLAKWHLKRIVLISRHETWQTVLARWPEQYVTYSLLKYKSRDQQMISNVQSFQIKMGERK